MLLDSNIIIYASQEDFKNVRSFIRKHNPAVSAISKVEVLGYHLLKANEQELLEQFFAAALVLPVSNGVINKATNLRCSYNMSLGDALIAATALVNNLDLVTHNTKDFEFVNGLALVDPITGN